MRVGVLGPLLVDGADARMGVRDRTVLAALAMRAGDTLSQEELGDAVWGDHLPSTWAKALQGCVSRLRRLLGQDAIQTLPRGYRLKILDGEVDAQQFEQLVRRSGELLTLGEPDRAAYTAGQALRLWRGRPLAELEEWEPAAREAVRLTELRLGAEEVALEAAMQSGRHQEVLAQARAMVDAAPLRERRWMLLALAQYRCGRQAEALATLQRLKRVLSGDLGLDPTPDVVALEDAILRQEPSLAVEPAIGTTSQECPYVGLQPYEESDAEVFFGREEELARCLERLGTHGVLAVIGPSGSGKSSLVRAGVAAALRRQGRDVQVVVPGRRPMDALAGVLLAPGRPVLVVDQAEDLFTVCDHPDQRQRFVAEVTAYAGRSAVVVALRADRTGELAEHPDLARLVERGLFLLGAMTGDSLRAAIQNPSRQAGLIVEPGLVDLLVREVEGEPGALPLLSHTLRETWLRREGRTLTVAGYQASGGVRGAVAQSAEELWGRVPPQDRALVKDLMLRLVAAGPEGEPVRARMPRRSVVADPALERVVDELVAARLLTSDNAVVEIAHESLARAWPRLRGWLDDDVEGRRTLHHLAAAAEAWDQLGRPESELYRGVRLAQVRHWRSAGSAELTAIERDFLESSEASERAATEAAAQRARQQTRMIRRLRVALIGAATLLLVAVGAGAVARRQAGRADREAEAATSSEIEATARGVAAAAVTDGNVSRSVLLALAAVRLDDSAATRSDLYAVLDRTPGLVGTTEPIESEIWGVAAGPTGDVIASYDTSNVVTTYDARDGQVLASYDTDGKQPPDVQVFPMAPMAFSPDGAMLAVGAGTYTRASLRLLDPHTLTPLEVQLGGQTDALAKIADISYSAGGRYLAVSSLYDPTTKSESNGTDGATSQDIRVWDLRHPDRAPAVVRLGDSVWDTVAISADGRTVYGSSPLTAYDVATGARLWRRPEMASFAPVRVTRDGRTLGFNVTVSGRHRAPFGGYLVDARTGRTVRTLPGGVASFSFDGKRVLVEAQPSDLVIDVASGRWLQRAATGDLNGSTTLSADGSSLLIADGGVIRTWDLTGVRAMVTRQRHSPLTGSAEVRFTPDGRYVAYDEAYTDVRIIDRRTGARVARLPFGAGDDNRNGQWSPDGSHYYSAGHDDVVRAVDTTGREVATWEPPEPGLSGTSLSADGTTLAVTWGSGRLALLDPATLRPLGPPLTLGKQSCCATLSPDGTEALVLTGNSGLRPGESSIHTGWALVDLQQGRVSLTGSPGAAIALASWSPDGSRVAIAGGKWVQVIDAATGQAVGPARTEHDDLVTALSWSPDGHTLLSGGYDATVAFWRGLDGHFIERVRVTPHSAGVYPSYLPDGTLVIGAEGGSVYAFDPSLARAVSFGCRLAGRELTADEWAQAFGDLPQQRVCPS
jgi:WD40 repeat protein/DNA-binding SARP family transcriptional activator